MAFILSISPCTYPRIDIGITNLHRLLLEMYVSYIILIIELPACNQLVNVTTLLLNFHI